MKIIRASMAMAALDHAAARRVYINDVRTRRVGYANLLQLGWEEVEAEAGSTMSTDGREILRAGGRTLALKPEVRQRLVAEAAARAQAKAKPKQETPGESLTSVLCPSCQAVMAKSPVCPRCEKGRAGFKILCICIECGQEVYL